MQTWGVRGTVAAVGIAVAIAGIGGAAVHAATESGPGFGNHGFGGPGFGGPGRGGPPPDRSSRQVAETAALHGEYVVTTGPGVFATRLSQVGQLTATSPTSVSVRSADGFAATYVIPPGANAPTAAVGEEVTVHATRDGQSATIQSIDRTSQRSGG